MVAHDISRHLFDPESRYVGLRMQQGRVSLDSDFNEARAMDDENRRLLVLDMIGPHGTPDAGFAIDDIQTDTYDFDIAAGTYYLGGLRHEIGLESFRAQSNWLQFDHAPGTPSLPTIKAFPGRSRHDLVYLVGWEQGVTSVEDRELREQAIAAQDTGYRVRRMHRVLVRTNTPADCHGAFNALIDDLTGDAHSFDIANHELKSNARLTVVYNPDAPGQNDVCRPAALQGFSGAENETIRVQLLGGERFLWGLDNASPLYRVTVDLNEVAATITFTTRPRDAAHQPRVGQVLEILPWGADLPNGEHVADHPIAPGVGGSVLARVLTQYDPDDATITVSLSVSEGGKLEAMLDWLTDKTGPHLFARIWNPGDVAGDDLDADPDNDALDTTFGIAFTPGQPVALAGTGFEVTFDRDGIVGDHWIVATRPATHRDVVPWNLATGALPHGPRRFYSPLAVIHWSFDDEDALQYEVHDCRRTFLPLTRIRGCCTVTVGDGETSFGDFNTIKDAVAAIPLDEPGKVCILPGTHEERVVLVSRQNLVLEGCGARTILRTHTSNLTSKGCVTLIGCANITLRSLQIEATGQFGVMMNDSNAVRIDRVDIRTSRDPEVPLPGTLWIPATPSPFPLSTIAYANGDHLSVVDCALSMDSDLSVVANVSVINAGAVRIERCRIVTKSLTVHASMAWGGVYLCNVSDFDVTDNLIEEGAGHGITFGTYLTASLPDDLTWFDPGGRLVVDPGDDCPHPRADLPLSAAPADGGPDVVVNPSYNANGHILRNRITGMSGSGISVLGFWPDDSDPYPMIETHELVIADNIIENNFQAGPIGALPDELASVVAFGGVALAAADNLHIHGNHIQDNGPDFRNPVCGIYVLHGENITIEHNLIRRNGPRIDDTGLSGIRAGIALPIVGRFVGLDPDIESDSLLPAARVRGNVVEQPAGCALQVHGIGPMIVEGNTLVSEGLTPGTPLPIPHCIDIQNVGHSPELLLETTVPANIGFLPAPPLPYDPPEPDDGLIDGRVLFTNNQVRFAPARGSAQGIFCANRLQSYGDIAVLDNQFLVLFPDDGGKMFTDTIVTAWSTRTNNNRWEDPGRSISGTGDDVEYETDVSATTVAFLNFTTLNQATRCIHATAADGAPSAGNPIAVNQTYINCDPDPGLVELLEAP